MTISQNVRFAGVSQIDSGREAGDTLGAHIARSLEATLRSRGLVDDPIELWRDVGWALRVRHGDADMQIAVAEEGSGSWMLQIGLATPPSVAARLLGRAQPDRSADLYAVACVVAELLADLGVTRARWRLDGPPQETDPGTPIPPAA
jgi:hypothetical protein